MAMMVYPGNSFESLRTASGSREIYVPPNTRSPQRSTVYCEFAGKTRPGSYAEVLPQLQPTQAAGGRGAVMSSGGGVRWLCVLVAFCRVQEVVTIAEYTACDNALFLCVLCVCNSTRVLRMVLKAKTTDQSTC
jgi:hypothetical protein